MWFRRRGEVGPDSLEGVRVRVSVLTGEKVRRAGICILR